MVGVGAFPDEATLVDLSNDGSPPVYPEVPADTGPMDRPYLQEMVSGLRHSPPTYVRDVQTGQPVPLALSEVVAGVVLLHF